MLFMYNYLFLLSKWADDSFMFLIAILFYAINLITSYIFILCEPGARMTNQFDIFSDEVNKCDWHLLPIELQ